MIQDNYLKIGKEVLLNGGNVLDIEIVCELDMNECCLMFFK